MNFNNFCIKNNSFKIRRITQHPTNRYNTYSALTLGYNTYSALTLGYNKLLYHLELIHLGSFYYVC